MEGAGTHHVERQVIEKGRMLIPQKSLALVRRLTIHQSRQRQGRQRCVEEDEQWRWLVGQTAVMCLWASALMRMLVRDKPDKRVVAARMPIPSC